MKIWGIGATWNNDMCEDFKSKNVVALGYIESEAPALYEIMKEIEVGDIIYVKSFPPGKIVHIKAVGVVISRAFETPNLFNDGRKHISVLVDWKHKSFDKNFLIKHELTERELKYNVYNNTVYREYNSDIINEVFSYGSNLK